MNKYHAQGPCHICQSLWYDSKFTYIDVFQPYPDAKVAGILCGTCGPCMYKVKAEMSVPSAFLESITPNSCATFNPSIAKVLALPLLRASYEHVTVCNGKSYSKISAGLMDVCSGGCNHEPN